MGNQLPYTCNPACCAQCLYEGANSEGHKEDGEGRKAVGLAVPHPVLSETEEIQMDLLRLDVQKELAGEVELWRMDLPLEMGRGNPGFGGRISVPFDDDHRTQSRPGASATARFPGEPVVARLEEVLPATEGRDGATFSEAASEMTPELRADIENFVRSKKVVTFMKGTPHSPQCGFSNKVVQILRRCGVPDSDWGSIDILERPEFNNAMKVYSNWSKFPQLYIDGEFFGGCNTVMDEYESGELQRTLEKALAW